ncbi:MAG TPA: hypothetical protein PLO62_12940 [Candidatus Hydrogenedentes bacterium]|nr:hypothetical protein [Candidatus Hydrogenedentota bacterium]
MRPICSGTVNTWKKAALTNGDGHVATRQRISALFTYPGAWRMMAMLAPAPTAPASAIAQA